MKTLLISLLLASTSLATLAASQPTGSSAVFASAGGQTVGGIGQAATTNSFANVNVKGEASAALAGGSLHAYAWSSNNPTLRPGCRPDMLSCNWGTSAEAWFYDTITIVGNKDIDGMAVPWHWSVHGTTTRGKWWSGSAAYSYFYVGIDPEGWRSATYLNAKNESREISSTFLLPGEGETLKLYIYGSLLAFAEGGAVADYSHTARFGWDLPDGVSYTSASGQFMAAAVPEPSSYALMLCGLAVLPWARRRLAGKVSAARAG